MTAGAAPPAAVIRGMEELGFRVVQVYGLTETYGPMVVSINGVISGMNYRFRRKRISRRDGGFLRACWCHDGC